MVLLWDIYERRDHKQDPADWLLKYIGLFWIIQLLEEVFETLLNQRGI